MCRCLALESPLDELGDRYLFSLHMTQHLLLGDIVPMCLLAGLNGPLLQPLLARLPVRQLRVLAVPYVALPIWALNLGLWFLPPLFDAAERHPVVHAAFHLCLLTAGTIMWMPVFEILADHGGVDERHAVVDEDRDAPERAQRREAVAAHERHDRIDLVRHALQVQADEHLAHVR